MSRSIFTLANSARSRLISLNSSVYRALVVFVISVLLA
jgi:hypothetical protein